MGSAPRCIPRLCLSEAWNKMTTLSRMDDVQSSVIKSATIQPSSVHAHSREFHQINLSYGYACCNCHVDARPQSSCTVYAYLGCSSPSALDGEC